ncbi:AMP-binding protein [Streptomyces sp. URMC 126]|uniref:AMP-binding protein n=1 Tax=Streptomyces sp. URMC 126 TaxID=3423401 RepID=UPI003F1C4C52
MTGDLGEHRAGTVVDALLDSAARTPGRPAFHVIERSGEEFALTYADVRRLVGRTVAGLRAHGIEEGDRVVVVLPTSRDFLSVYLGCLHAGVVPVVAAEPAGDRRQDATQVRDLAVQARATRVVAAPERADALAAFLPVPVITPEALRGTSLALGPPRAAPASLAHLQATSGSTGTPKLAVVRHGNIVANVRAIAEAIRARPTDSLVSWLPLFHDMGLIGISYALHARIPMVLADPLNFLRNPMSWLHWISRHRGTLSPAPSSAFHICARVAERRPPADLDLSSWRVALCGAEPVHEATLRAFQAAFGPFGLPETTLRPVYGLAEATLAATISDVTRPYTVDRVDARAVAAGERAEPRPAGDPRGVSMMCVGPAVPGHRLRVVDPDGTPLPDRAIGEIEVAGPSLIDGYLAGPDDPGTVAADDRLKRPDGYLRTGDLGYLLDGELYVTGRRKEIVIISGRNYIPDQIERFVETVVESPRVPAVVAVGVPDPTLLTERLHLLLDERIGEGRDRRALAERVRGALADTFGIGGVTVHWIRRARLPRTTSGKVRRHLCREIVEELSAHAPAPTAGPDSTRSDVPTSRRA